VAFRSYSHDFPDLGDSVRVIWLTVSHESRLQRTELVALDIREQGAILSWVVRTLKGDEPPRLPLLSVTDDRSGIYAAPMLDSDLIGQRLVGRTLLVPQPSAEAGVLYVNIFEAESESQPPAPMGWHRLELRL
jgi:hypothetical protein